MKPTAPLRGHRDHCADVSLVSNHYGYLESLSFQVFVFYTCCVKIILMAVKLLYLLICGGTFCLSC